MDFTFHARRFVCFSILLAISAVALGAEKGTGTIYAKHPSGRSGKLSQSPFLHAKHPSGRSGKLSQSPFLAEKVGVKLIVPPFAGKKTKNLEKFFNTKLSAPASKPMNKKVPKVFVSPFMSVGRKRTKA